MPIATRCFPAGFPLIACLLATTVAAQKPSFEPRELGEIPEGLKLSGGSTQASSTGSSGGPPGAQQMPNAGYSEVIFSPDGTRYAYVGYQEGQTVPVVDGVIGEPWHFLSWPVFSGDSRHVVFRAGNRTGGDQESWVALLDGEPTKPIAWIGEIGMAPNGTLAFWAQPDAKIQTDGTYSSSEIALLFGKRESQPFDSQLIQALAAPRFFKDGKGVAAIVHDGSSAKVLLMQSNGRQQLLPKGSHPIINDFAISENGKRLACAVATTPPGMDPGMMPPGMTSGMGGGPPTIECDGKTYGDDFDGAGVPVLSADGKVLAFKVLKGDRMGIATARQLQARKPVCTDYSFVGVAVIHDKGDRLAFAGYEGNAVLASMRLTSMADQSPKIGSTCHLVVRGVTTAGETQGEAYEDIRHITFPPRGDEVAHAGKQSQDWWVVWGEKKAGPYRQVGPLAFDRAGKKLAFGAVKGRKILWEVLE